MLISEIYDEYKIMPQLQTHMYRVAAVGECIAKKMDIPVELDSITSACLLHDMGNIIKFNLEVFPDFLEPEGLAYWQRIKSEYIAKYGTDEHGATDAIVRELKLSNRIVEIVNTIGFSHAKECEASGDFNFKICAYADLRVSPHGVLSLNERLEEGRKRYGIVDNQHFAMHHELADHFRAVEKQIFEHCSLTPDDITNAYIHTSFEQLEHYDVPGTINPHVV